MSQARLALLRGINLGGRRTIPMAELRGVASGLGWEGVATYIASGNLVFTAEGSDADLAATLSASIETRFGFAVDVLVVAGDVFADAVARHPFAEGDPKRVHLGWCSRPWADADLAHLQDAATPNERVAVAGPVVYADFADGVHQSTLATRLPRLARPGFVTLRNLQTSRALADLVT